MQHKLISEREACELVELILLSTKLKKVEIHLWQYPQLPGNFRWLGLGSLDTAWLCSLIMLTAGTAPRPEGSVSHSLKSAGEAPLPGSANIQMSA